MSIFRFDRLITLYFSQYINQLLATKNEHIPILMYHSISNEDEQRVHPYYKTNTTPAIFDEHMSFLYNNNYKVINLNDALKHLHSNSKLKEKYIVITFDDGYRDFYECAFPILNKYNFSATVFLTTDYIGKNELFKGKKCLNWNEVIELQKKNIIFGSHTMTHPLLVSLTNKDIEYELSQSKAVIEDNIGKLVESFSYPYAFPERNIIFIQNLRNILLKYGYRNSVSTIIGTAGSNADHFFLKRIPANSDDDENFFKAKLEGAYNWLHRPQSFIKFLKQIKPKSH